MTNKTARKLNVKGSENERDTLMAKNELIQRIKDLAQSAKAEQLAYLAKALDTLKGNLSNSEYSDCNNGEVTNNLKNEKPYRWTKFSTYHDSDMVGESAKCFGGITLERWRKQKVEAHDINHSVEYMNSLFNRKGYGGKNTIVICTRSVFYNQEENNEVGLVMFRVKNITEQVLTWNVCYNYSSHDRMGYVASVSMNSTRIWSSEGMNTESSVEKIKLSIPAKKTSTIIFVSPAHITMDGSGLVSQYHKMGFVNDCLSLSEGLHFVDDLDSYDDDYLLT
ncbi:MAG: hypothetical protein AAF669_08260 [Pseudomonadota bacterium]